MHVIIAITKRESHFPEELHEDLREKTVEDFSGPGESVRKDRL